jgi:putative copper resistance protein D
MSPDFLSVIVRAAASIALLQAAGAAMFLWQFGAALGPGGAAVRRLGMAAALLAVPLLAMQVLLDAARMTGDYAGMLDGEMLRLALGSASGTAHAVQLAGLALVAQGLRRAGSPRVAMAGAAALVVAFVFTGHTAAHGARWLLAPLLALHVAIVAFWFGALAPLYMVIAREPVQLACAVLQRYSRLAGILVPLIPAAGLAMAFVLLPDLSALRRPYGLLLGLKVLGFAMLMVLAALNRWRWVPALAAGAAPVRMAPAHTALRRSLVSEYLLIVAVLLATAVLTTFYSPTMGAE